MVEVAQRLGDYVPAQHPDKLCLCSADGYECRFYNCDYDSDRHAIVSEAGKYSNVTYGASFVYPWLTGAFGPENGTRLPDYATHSFANSLTVLPAL